MYRDAKTALDERDRAVGAILIGEALIASCERAQVIGDRHGSEAWRAIRDAHDDFPEIWRSLDRARHVLAQRGVNVLGYDELRPHVRTRLATARDDDAETVRLDPAALDDARRAAEELKLAVPGADWAAIDHRTRGLVGLPLLRRRRHRWLAGGMVALFLAAVVTWLASLVPYRKPSRAAEMRRELAQITVERRIKIIELQLTLGEHCNPPKAEELAKQLVMDGRGDDARQFATSYTARCGEDTVIARWANAPRP
jgi:hypothetical protein